MPSSVWESALSLDLTRSQIQYVDFLDFKHLSAILCSGSSYVKSVTVHVSADPQRHFIPTMHLLGHFNTFKEQK